MNETNMTGNPFYDLPTPDEKKDAKQEDVSSSGKFPKQDLEALLRRAFVDKRFSNILLDGHDYSRVPFLVESVRLGLDNGWLKYDGTIEEQQWTTEIYILTDDGKKYFGLKANS